MSGIAHEVYDAFCDVMEDVGPDRAARMVAALVAVHVMSHPAGPKPAWEELRNLTEEAMLRVGTQLLDG